MEKAGAERNARQRFAALLWELAQLERAADTRRSFRANAYSNAVWALDQLSPDLHETTTVMLEAPGLGPGTVGLIEEFDRSGSIRRLDRLRTEFPASSPTLRRLPRMNPSRLRLLKSELGVDTVHDLRTSITEGSVQRLSGVGIATQALWGDRLARAVDHAGMPIAAATDLAWRWAGHLQRHLGVRAQPAGALARLEEWIERIELTTNDPADTTAFLAESALVQAPPHGRDPVEAAALGAPIAIRSAASSGMAATKGSPQLTADLHVHSDWSPDGRQSFESIIDAARRHGLSVIAITDHAADLHFGGLSPVDLERRRASMVADPAYFSGIAVLQGAELNIGRSGSLDYDDETLASLDFRLAAVHSHFDLDEAEQTDRLLAAISHPLVHGIAHLTGRRIGNRPPIRLDLKAVFEAAAECSTALEVNGHLDRLDLSVEHCRTAAAAGVLFMANSDAHRTTEFANLSNALTVLSRAQVPADRVVNRWPAERLLNWIGGT